MVNSSISREQEQSFYEATGGSSGCATNQYAIPQFNTIRLGSVGSNAGTLVLTVVVLRTWVEWALSTGGNMTQYLYQETIITPDAVIIAHSQSGQNAQCSFS